MRATDDHTKLALKGEGATSSAENHASRDIMDSVEKEDRNGIAYEGKEQEASSTTYKK
jgi:hypothetical protein